MQECDKSDILTKSEVTRSIIDSGQALANRLRTREQSTDNLVHKLEQYYQALHAEDWAGKSASAVKTGAVMMGITASVVVILACKFIKGLFNYSALVGFNLALLCSYPWVIGYFIKLFNDGYKKFSTADPNPSQARYLLSRTVDPAENQVYALIGGSRPARTFERVEQGGAILVGVITFIVASGIVWGFLNFLIAGI
jgi:hypothetical protein